MPYEFGHKDTSRWISLRAFEESFDHMTGMACKQWKLTRPNIWFRPFLDLHMFIKNQTIMISNMKYWYNSKRIPKCLTISLHGPQDIKLPFIVVVNGDNLVTITPGDIQSGRQSNVKFWCMKTESDLFLLLLHKESDGDYYLQFFVEFDKWIM